MENSVGPLSVVFWKELRIDPKNEVKNVKSLVTSMVVASQRHQLRPLLINFYGFVEENLKHVNDFLEAVDLAAKTNYDTTKLPLDTVALLLKILKMLSKDRFKHLNGDHFLKKAMANIYNNHLMAFSQMAVAYFIFFYQDFENVPKDRIDLLCKVIGDIKEDDEGDFLIHDEVRIMALQIYCLFVPKNVENFTFICNEALPILSQSSSTPSRERFCSILIDTLKAIPKQWTDKVLTALVAMDFDETNYALQRCFLRLFRDLVPMNESTLMGIYVKLLKLCQSDFNDVRRQTSQILTPFCKNFVGNGENSLKCLEITTNEMEEIVGKVTSMTGDNFYPAKAAFQFERCLFMATTLKIDFKFSFIFNDQKISINFDKNEDDFHEIFTALDEIVRDYNEKAFPSLLFTMALSNLLVKAEQSERFFKISCSLFDLFFGDNSIAFNDRSLGGYKTGREHFSWAILQMCAKSLAIVCQFTHNYQQTFEIIQRVLFNTLHFGLLEEYSAILTAAVICWPNETVPLFETLLCKALLEDEQGGEQSEESLCWSEVRRGGGLSLAFVALFKGLAKLERFSDMERIIRDRILPYFKLTNCQEWQGGDRIPAIFHAVRAIFHYVKPLGPPVNQQKLFDDVACLAFASLTPSTPFQTRNAAIQALQSCVQSTVSEGTSSLWKFYRAFPKLWLKLKQLLMNERESLDHRNGLMVTAALSLLARIDPLMSPNDADGQSWDIFTDDGFEDRLFQLATESPIAPVRSAAAAALVSIACSHPNENAVDRAVLLLTIITPIVFKRVKTPVDSNFIHGIVLILDNISIVLKLSWTYYHYANYPVVFDRCKSVLVGIFSILNSHLCNCPFLSKLINEKISLLNE